MTFLQPVFFKLHNKVAVIFYERIKFTLNNRLKGSFFVLKAIHLKNIQVEFDL